MPLMTKSSFQATCVRAHVWITFIAHTYPDKKKMLLAYMHTHIYRHMNIVSTYHFPLAGIIWNHFSRQHIFKLAGRCDGEVGISGDPSLTPRFLTSLCCVWDLPSIGLRRYFRKNRWQIKTLGLFCDVHSLSHSLSPTSLMRVRKGSFWASPSSR
jgi:hypothetical protein